MADPAADAFEAARLVYTQRNNDAERVCHMDVEYIVQRAKHASEESVSNGGFWLFSDSLERSDIPWEQRISAIQQKLPRTRLELFPRPLGNGVKIFVSFHSSDTDDATEPDAEPTGSQTPSQHQSEPHRPEPASP